jgi:type II secretory pathway pseudopilin PulG
VHGILSKNQNREKGFSLVELVIVIFLIIFLSLIVFSRGFSVDSNLKASAADLLDTVKEVRQMSLSVKQFYNTGIFPNYGIGFDTGNPTQVRIYADCTSDDNADFNLDNNDRFTYEATTQYPSFPPVPAPYPNIPPNPTPPNPPCPAPQSGLIENHALLYGARITALRVYDSGNTLIYSPTRAYVEYFRPEPSTWIAVIDGTGGQQVLSVGRLDIEIKDASGAGPKTITISTTGRITLQ